MPLQRGLDLSLFSQAGDKTSLTLGSFAGVYQGLIHTLLCLPLVSLTDFVTRPPLDHRICRALIIIAHIQVGKQ